MTRSAWRFESRQPNNDYSHFERLLERLHFDPRSFGLSSPFTFGTRHRNNVVPRSLPHPPSAETPWSSSRVLLERSGPVPAFSNRTPDNARALQHSSPKLRRSADTIGIRIRKEASLTNLQMTQEHHPKEQPWPRWAANGRTSPDVILYRKLRDTPWPESGTRVDVIGTSRRAPPASR